jgi:F-type H+-transporting ATPase subunit gamma
MRSIEQTLKVTKAMNLISTSKLRKGRRLLADAEPYFTRVQKTMSDILNSPSPLEKSVYFTKEQGNTAVIVITTDKGLAGGYNANIFHYTRKLCSTLEKPVLIIVGNVGQRYFMNTPHMVLENFSFNSKIPTVEDASEISEYLLSQFDWGVFSGAHVVYTHMYNALKLVPEEKQLLPLDKDKMFVKPSIPHKEEPSFECIPDERTVFESLVPIYLQGVLYGCLVESYAAEQSARMTAMDEATRNGNEMLAKQSLFYNKVRQAGITQEVTEIVSGSAALEQ